MLATPLSAKDKRVDELNTFQLSDGTRLLKLAAIYGANSGGKSNFMKALRFMKSFAIESSKSTQAGDRISVEPFRLSPETASKPSSFEVVFSVESTVYRYGFSATQARVLKEWLQYWPKGREATLFERDGDAIRVNRRSFREGASLVEHTRPNALFLSVVAQFNGEIATRVLNWFDSLKVISGLTDEEYRHFTITGCENDRNREAVRGLISAWDLGIEDIEVEKEPLTRTFPKGLPAGVAAALERELGEVQRAMLRTAHKVFDESREVVGVEQFDLDEHESDGTKKAISLAGPMLDAIAHGRVLVIDELDSRMHPKLTREIVRLFQATANSARPAQLIFATHDVGLLKPSLLRRDQVFFAKKDRFGASRIDSLAEYRGVRNDLSYRRAYLQGRFGAVPRIEKSHLKLTAADGDKS